MTGLDGCASTLDFQMFNEKHHQLPTSLPAAMQTKRDVLHCS